MDKKGNVINFPSQSVVTKDVPANSDSEQLATVSNLATERRKQDIEKKYREIFIQQFKNNLRLAQLQQDVGNQFRIKRLGEDFGSEIDQIIDELADDLFLKLAESEDHNFFKDIQLEKVLSLKELLLSKGFDAAASKVYSIYRDLAIYFAKIIIRTE